MIPKTSILKDEDDALSTSKGGLYGYGLDEEEKDDSDDKNDLDVDDSNPDEMSYSDAGLEDFDELDKEDIEE